MNGSEKLPLLKLKIDKLPNPRCFKKVKTKPIIYELTKQAWMTNGPF